MIRAIETKYAGCRFRSRIEARWAVFFDALRIPWEYEPQGYVIDDVAYLPDFYLPKHSKYVEIKGGRPSDPEVRKVLKLAEAVRETASVTLFQGDIPRTSVLRTCGAVPCQVANTIEGVWALSPGVWIIRNSPHEVDDALERARSARFEHGESG